MSKLRYQYDTVLSLAFFIFSVLFQKIENENALEGHSTVQYSNQQTDHDNQSK